MCDDIWQVCDDIWQVCDDIWRVCDDIWQVCDDIWQVYDDIWQVCDDVDYDDNEDADVKQSRCTDYSKNILICSIAMLHVIFVKKFISFGEIMIR